jgi:hypothetical protein
MPTFLDIVNPGWVPVYNSNLTEDIPGYVEAPANALAWKHFIGGHLGRLGTRDDVTLPAVHGRPRRQHQTRDRYPRLDGEAGERIRRADRALDDQRRYGT